MKLKYDILEKFLKLFQNRFVSVSFQFPGQFYGPKCRTRDDKFLTFCRYFQRRFQIEGSAVNWL